MKQTVPLGRVAGIRVGMHWSVLVMVIMIAWLLGGQVLPLMTPHQPTVAYWAVAVPCAAAFMVALLAHELAHSLVARRYGMPVTSITLWALGGISELGGQPPTARAELRIAAAGPATSLAAGLIFGGLAVAVRAGGGPGLAVAALGWLAGVTGTIRLARVPPASRASTTLGQVMAPVPPAYLAAPDDPAAPLLSRPPLADDLAAIVLSGGRITGIVTVARLRQVVRREALRAQPGR